MKRDVHIVGIIHLINFLVAKQVAVEVRKKRMAMAIMGLNLSVITKKNIEIKPKTSSQPDNPSR